MEFNLDVMNFEIEGLTLQNILKNIQQKLMITKHSIYMKNTDSEGLILVSGDPTQKSKILLVNQVICNMTGFTTQHLIGKNVNCLMPKLIGQVHDAIIERFLTSNHNRHLTSGLPRVWLKKKNQCIVPCRVEIQTCVSRSKGLVLVAKVLFNLDIQTPNINCKMEDAYFMITDEFGYIENASENFMKRYLPKDQFAIEDSKINAEELIQY